MPAPPGPGRRLLRRIPVRVRHHWRLLAGCVALLVVLTVGFSTVRVQPYVTSGGSRAGDEVTQDLAGTRELFDPTVAHSISLTFRDSDYERMVDTFAKEGEKEYLEADLTIDGTTVPSVGIRLKGNSTLAGLTRDGEVIGSRPGGQGGPADGEGPARGAPGADGPGGARPGDAGAAGNQPGAPGGAARPGGAGRTALKAEEPETLPWLIRFDEFVAGRRYQGHREIAVRVGGMGGGSTVLNEAVSLRVLAEAGEAAPAYAYSRFVVNDRPATARLVIEHPGSTFADGLDGDGVLYKALASGSFTDQGDDPTDYQDDFRQITGRGDHDLQPVIDLVRWVADSSDAEFDAHLADHVDVDSFARYVAWQNLLLNFDDMSGPGRNYYLWYDLTTKKFTIVGWDYNLTFSGSADQGPHDAGRMGGGLPRPGVQPPAGDRPTDADRPTADSQQPQDGQAPQDGQGSQSRRAPQSGQMPEGARPSGRVPGQGDGERMGGGPGGGHKLKERFLASSAFTNAYEQAYRELYREVYADGAALTALDDLVGVVSTVEGHGAQSLATEAERLRTLIRERTSSLAGHEVVTGN
ncbi:CotH kinase family protein [Micromonospora sp. NPDC048170]|uniref:CotH kinase family protein n=1 Tax=Micromonospora sp. NPDC048170 TaxID=3154819 RepID=UPI0034075FB0